MEPCTTFCSRKSELQNSNDLLLVLNRKLEQQVKKQTEILRMLQLMTSLANEARTVDEGMLNALAEIAQNNGWAVGHLWKSSGGESERLESSKLWFCVDKVSKNDALAAFRDETEKLQIGRGEGLIGLAFADGMTSWTNDIDGHAEALGRCNLRTGFKAVIAIPIVTDKEVVAIMEFFSWDKVEPDECFLETIPTIGIQLGHVVRRRRLEQALAKVVLDEQCRIGRELHDGIAQQLTGGALIAEAFLRSLPPEQSEQRKKIQQLAEIFSRTHRDVRQLLNGLLPACIDAVDLLPALKGLAQEISQRFGLSCRLDDSQYVSDLLQNQEVASAVYQVAQEAVYNAVKHASATEITISLADSDNLCLSVKDNGVGRERIKSNKTSYGIRIMRHRGEAVGGGLIIDSKHGSGTTVVLTIPGQRCF
jgi:signal transduction histidine kinase